MENNKMHFPINNNSVKELYEHENVNALVDYFCTRKLYRDKTTIQLKAGPFSLLEIIMLRIAKSILVVTTYILLFSPLVLISNVNNEFSGAIVFPIEKSTYANGTYITKFKLQQGINEQRENIIPDEEPLPPPSAPILRRLRPG